jgi:ribose/xylose/arabinose/galactoside ABC-type transport system permease subunit
LPAAALLSSSAFVREILRKHAAGICLALLVVFDLAFTPNFASTANLWNVLVQAAPTAIVASGMTLVIAVSGVDLSVGSVMALASAAAAMSLPHGVAVAITVALAAAAAIGFLNGAVVSRFRVQPIVVTLATLIAARGLAQVISRDGQLIPISSISFEQLGRGAVGPVPVQVIIAALVIAFTALVMRTSILGRHILAVGGNDSAAALAGVNVWRTRLIVYVASALLAAAAGLIEAARLGASDAAKIGVNMELDAIAATVIGGTPLRGGHALIGGTLLGTLLIQVITTTMNMRLVPYSWSLVIKAAIVLTAVYIQREAES